MFPYSPASDSGGIHGYAETEVFAPAVVRAEAMVRAGSIGDVSEHHARLRENPDREVAACAGRPVDEQGLPGVAPRGCKCRP